MLNLMNGPLSQYRTSKRRTASFVAMAATRPWLSYWAYGTDPADGRTAAAPFLRKSQTNIFLSAPALINVPSLPGATQSEVTSASCPGKYRTYVLLLRLQYR